MGFVRKGGLGSLIKMHWWCISFIIRDNVICLKRSSLKMINSSTLMLHFCNHHAPMLHFRKPIMYLLKDLLLMLICTCDCVFGHCSCVVWQVDCGIDSAGPECGPVSSEGTPWGCKASWLTVRLTQSAVGLVLNLEVMLEQENWDYWSICTNDIYWMPEMKFFIIINSSTLMLQCNHHAPMLHFQQDTVFKGSNCMTLILMLLVLLVLS